MDKQKRPSRSDGLTILGTDTEVGKTFVACRILESLVRDGVAVGAYKPVASGAPTLEQSDGFQLWQASGQRGSLADVTPQRFLAPLAPPIAAELEGLRVSDALIFDGARHWSGRCQFLVVEGAGGLMSPISWTMTNAALALELQFSVVLVAENRLGVVNQVLTTLTAARSIGLHVCCIVLNEIRNTEELAIQSNERLLRRFLEKFSDAPKITRLPCDGEGFMPAVRWQDLVAAKLSDQENGR